LNGFWVQHQIGLIAFLSVLLLIALSNLRALRHLNVYSLPSDSPYVSVLVPARNEEANIGPCVSSLLNQEYPDFEVLVLDDNSSNGTVSSLALIGSKQSRLQILRGAALPDDWLGKHWACHQLAQAAEGEVLLFTDADTVHHRYALRDAVAALLGEEADLVTALPRQETVSFAEQLIVPLIPWSILSFLPICLAHRVGTPLVSAAAGQFMLFRRQAYEQIGGHSDVRQHATDDLALARKIKARGLRWRLLDGRTRIHCRMYHSFQEAHQGLSKNLFAAFEYHLPAFVLIWIWLTVVFLEPLVIVAIALAGRPLGGVSTLLAATAAGMSLLLWAVCCWRFGFSLHVAICYPVRMLLAVMIAMGSMVLTLLGRTTWKGRRLAKHRVRWWS